MNSIERFLAGKFGRQFCVFTGRAATAIYLICRAIRRTAGAGEVILPAVSCTSPANSVFFAGMKPVFADVNMNDFCINLASTRKRITPQTKAVIPIHLFGHCMDLTDFENIAQRPDIFVIEDAAQAIGGKSSGRRSAGSMGDFSVLSFGRSKIIESGGGAVLCDDKAFYALISAENKRLRSPGEPALRMLGESYRNLNHGLIQLRKTDREFHPARLFSSLLPHYRSLYVHRHDSETVDENRLRREIEALESDAGERRRKALLYRKYISHDGIIHPEITPSDTIWRYSVLIKSPSKLQAITDALRKKGFHASNLYWNAADFFQDKSRLKNAIYISRRVLNLWIDKNIDDGYIEKSCEIILNCLRHDNC
jgi:dTDP-4-amino-4,6-dideoxygalactose transaminase